MKKLKETLLLNKIYRNKFYKGKHVILINGKIYTARTGLTASKMLETLLEKYPKVSPTITYIPKADTLILLYRKVN